MWQILAPPWLSEESKLHSVWAEQKEKRWNSRMSVIPITRSVVPNTSSVVPITSSVVPNTSSVVLNTSFVVPNTSSIVHNTSSQEQQEWMEADFLLRQRKKGARKEWKRNDTMFHMGNKYEIKKFTMPYTAWGNQFPVSQLPRNSGRNTHPTEHHIPPIHHLLGPISKFHSLWAE